MISKITFTPNAFTMQNNNCCGSKKGIDTPFHKGNAVSFESAKIVKPLTTGVRNESPLTKTVKRVFDKLAQNRLSNNSLGQFMTTTKNNKADIFIRETQFGKKANLTLSNGVFGDKSYMNFTIERASGKAPIIEAADEDISSKDAAKIVTTYLSELK